MSMGGEEKGGLAGGGRMSENLREVMPIPGHKG